MNKQKMVWVSGDTYRNRERLKQLSGVYDRETRRWKVPAEKLTAEVVRALHGCTVEPIAFEDDTKPEFDQDDLYGEHSQYCNRFGKTRKFKKQGRINRKEM